MRKILSAFAVALFTCLCFCACSKEETASNPLKGTVWSYDDFASLSKEQYKHYIEFIDDTNVKIWDTFNTYAAATGTYTVSGNTVTFNKPRSKYWMKQYERATFTSNSMTVYYKYFSNSDGTVYDGEYQEIFLKQ